MKESNFISGYICIRDNKAILNGESLFSGEKDMDFGEFIRALYKSSGISYSPFYKMDDLSKLGFCASELLLAKEKEDWKYKDEEVGIVFSNKSSSLDTDLNYFDTIKNQENYFPSPAVFVYTLPNIVIGEISIKHKIKGENSFFIFPEFDPVFTCEYIEALLNTEKLNGCLVGWVEYFQENYHAFMYFVKREYKEEGILHSAENISNLFNQF